MNFSDLGGTKLKYIDNSKYFYIALCKTGGKEWAVKAVVGQEGEGAWDNFLHKAIRFHLTEFGVMEQVKSTQSIHYYYESITKRQQLYIVIVMICQVSF